MNKNYLIESLTSYMGRLEEARNLENDEINTLIKSAANNKKIGKNLEKKLAQYGIKVDDARHRLIGPNGRVLRMDLYPGTPQPQKDNILRGPFSSTAEKHDMSRPGRTDNFDYLNYLTVDREFDDSSEMYYNHYKIKNPGEDNEITRDSRRNPSTGEWDSSREWKDFRSPESKSLRPYSDEYRARVADRRETQDKFNSARRELNQKNKELKNLVSNAKSRNKNESLALEEGRRDLFNAGTTDAQRLQSALSNAIVLVLRDYDCLNISESDLRNLLDDFLDEFYTDLRTVL